MPKLRSTYDGCLIYNDNAKVTIDLRRLSNLQNILRQTYDESLEYLTINSVAVLK